MKTLCALGAIVSIATIAGCGGSQPPIGAPGAMPQTRALAAHVDHGKSWMLPEAKSEDLLYVSRFDADDVYVYDYKTGLKVGKLGGLHGPYGQCIDKSGDVWIVNLKGESIVEYAHGGIVPLKMLATNGAALGCAVSPSGDLAVDNYSTPSGGSDIQIFRNASGKGREYEDQTDCPAMWPPAYDDKVNLYVEPGFISGSSFWMCELSAKSHSLEKIPLNGYVSYPDGTIWDGQHIALADLEYNGNYETAIYQTRYSASGGLTVNGTTQLVDGCYGGYSEIKFPFVVGKKNTPINHEQGNVVIGSNTACRPHVMEFWRYPNGGEPFRTIVLTFQPSAQSVSLANR